MRHHIIAIRRAISRNKQTIITNVDENVKQLELLCITDRNVKWYTSVENNRHFSKEMSLFSPIQPLSRVWLFATPWTAAHQASLSITNSQSLLKLMSIELAMPSNHLIFCQMANKHMKRCSTSFMIQSVQFQCSCSVVSDSLWPHELQHASLSITSSRSLLKLMPIESVMPSSHLILCCPLLLLPPIPPSIRVFSNESTLRIRWPKYWSFNFSISPSNECTGLISFRINWLDLLAVQGTLKSLLQHHSSKASILRRSFIIKGMQIKTTMGYHLTLDRMAIIKKKKFTNNKCWRGCGEKRTFLHCWWWCKLIQPLWKTVWRSL